MKKRLIQGSIFLVFVFVVLCPIAAVEAGGYWQQEPPIIEIANGGKSCQVGQWPAPGGWQRQIVDFSATHVNFGFSHPKVQPGWSRVKAWWQAPPAVLYPKQKISFQFGANIVGWHPLSGDVAVWVYKMPGIGPGEQLGAVYAKTSGSYTTKLHQVPDGFSGEAPRDARLGYFMGVNDGCRAIFMYKWVPDKSGQGTATPTPAKQGLTIEPNTDRYGSDYKYLRGVDSPAACRSICAGESACRAYTWVKAGYMEEQALCWLKNAVPAPTRNDNCVSGVKQK